ncbi:MAG TPA: DUF2298 domain-containing protein [Thermoanaerobaculaceae bacterium]|nr:DUF2298 domain-containing protein [Thermoanaerobaculaceae bacterium]
MVLPVLIWYVVVAAAGALTFGALRRVGLGSGAAWATARVCGLVVQAWVAWLAGNLGLAWWWWLGFIPLAGLWWWGRREWKGTPWKHLLEPELVGLGAFLLLAFLRLPVLAVTATEKPMDLAILNTLLRPGVFPPVDPWLAGWTLPYYYWGFMPWALPAKLAGLAPDVIFNLLVPTLALVSAQAAWALARGLGGSRRTGIMAAGLVVFTGTLDGWRQWLSGTALGGLDLWPSSRQITGTITEFPLFTFHLGDLHPHLLSVPLMLVAVFLGRALCAQRRQAPLPLLALLVLVFGAAGAANPWCAVPTGLAILLAVVCDEHELVTWRDGGWKVWARVVAVGILGWVAFSPFWLRFHPPAEGFGLVTTGTQVDQFMLLMGAAILPLFLVGWELSWRWGGLDLARRQLSRATWLAGTVCLILMTRRFALGLAIGLGVVTVVTMVRGRVRWVRPALAISLVGLVLLAFMELVFFKDPYGTEFYRMNTVFKAVTMAFTLLAVTAPVLLGWLRRRRYWLASVAAALVLAAGLPQVAALAARAIGGAWPGSWSGLAWMANGEPEVVAWLREQPRGTVIIEAVGDAYSDAARMSASSGVTAVLGWDNHEGVWRGSSINEETGRRRKAIEELYHSGDPERVRQIARELGAHLVIVGAVEKRLYTPEGVAAARRAGRVVFERGECAVVQIAEPPTAPAQAGTTGESGRGALDAGLPAPVRVAGGAA